MAKQQRRPQALKARRFDPKPNGNNGYDDSMRRVNPYKRSEWRNDLQRGRFDEVSA